MDVKKLPWAEILSIAGMVMMTTATTLMNQHKEKRMIEEIGTKVGDEVIKALREEQIELNEV